MQGYVKDVFGNGTNDLSLGADAPAWVYSTAPLAYPGQPPGVPGSQAWYLSMGSAARSMGCGHLLCWGGTLLCAHWPGHAQLPIDSQLPARPAQ